MTDYTRQRAWYDPSERPNDAVTIVGCGGIGSFTAIALAKLGVPKLALIDFDFVDEHNLPNQHFRVSDLGMPKVDALAEQIAAIAPDCRVTTYCDKFGNITFPMNPVVIAGLDNMAGRKELWGLLRMRLPVKLYIDGRLAGQQIVQYCVKPTSIADMREYEGTLYDDATALEDSCTAKSIIDVASMIASLNVRAARLAFTDPDTRQSPITYMDQHTLTLARGEWV